jgi:phospholipid transport system substrate-binding protein
MAAVVLAISFTLPARAQDREAEIRTMLEERDAQIKTLLGDGDTFTDAQREQLRDVINDGINFRAMGKLALGKYWDGLSSEQRTDFVDVFSEIVRIQSLSDLDVYRAVVTYEDITVSGDSAQVVTAIVYKDVPTQVEYLMGLEENTWHVVDIILDGVSTADGYAGSFQALIRKKGFDALMDKLRQRREEVNASSR